MPIVRARPKVLLPGVKAPRYIAPGRPANACLSHLAAALAILPPALVSRRQALNRLNRLAAAWALHSLFAPSAHAAQARPWQGRNTPFLLGVASGQPRPGGVVLWTRLVASADPFRSSLPAAPVAVRWELAEDAGFTRIVQRGEVVALPDHGHSVHVALEGLPPDSRFHYRFISGRHASPVGRTRTAPAEGADVARLRIALASCQHYEQGWFTVHREIAQREADFVLFVGDYIYGVDASHHRQLRRHTSPTPSTLEGFRMRHLNYRLDPDLQAAHAAHPWIVTLDDHDVQNDYAGDRAAYGLSAADFLHLRAQAYKAYFEHLPLAPQQAPEGPFMRIHDRFAWGRLADLFVVDTRQFRSPHGCARPGERQNGKMTWWGCAETDAPQRTVLGAQQEQGLHQGLAASTRRWKLLAQTTQMSPYSLPLPWGRAVYSDGWDGYPQARARLLQAIAAQGVANVVCLGGDVHRNVAAPLRLRPQDRRSPVVASEFVTTSITSHGLNVFQNLTTRLMNPDLLHLRSDERGYTWLEITPQRLRCDFRTTAHPVRPGAQLHTQASFVVDEGVPGPRAA